MQNCNLENNSRISCSAVQIQYTYIHIAAVQVTGYSAVIVVRYIIAIATRGFVTDLVASEF